MLSLGHEKLFFFGYVYSSVLMTIIFFYYLQAMSAFLLRIIIFRLNWAHFLSINYIPFVLDLTVFTFCVSRN